MRKLISLCMIVKNEEDVIERCLTSASGLVDEIIVVDTGSTDETVNIASRFTEHVYHFEWVNDFSAARNAAIAKATGEWILILDADEYVQDEGKEKLRKYLSKVNEKKQNAVEVSIYNIVNGANIIDSASIRIFLNSPDISYVNAIHEQVSHATGNLLFDSFDFVIYHTGYVSEVMEKKQKSKRNMEIFQSLKANGKLTPYQAYTLGNEYQVLKEYQEAIENYEYAYKSSKNTKWQVHCAYYLLQAYIKTNQLDLALKVVDESIRLWPNSTDFYFVKGNILTSLGLQAEAIELFETCIRLSTAAGASKFWEFSPDSGALIPYLCLSEIYKQALDIPKVVAYLTQYLQINRQDILNLCSLIRYLLQSENTSNVINFLQKIYPGDVPENLYILFRAGLLIGNHELVEHYYNALQAHTLTIAPSMLLRRALLLNSSSMFSEVLSDVPSDFEEQDINRSLYLSTCAWKDTAYLNRLNKELENYSASWEAFLQCALNGSTADVRQDDIQIVSNLLTDLFTIGSYEVYDWLINLLPAAFQDKIANDLGNYFFSIHQMEMSVDYYSLLVQKDTLQETGYWNLYLLYKAQGELEEAIDFLKKTIELNSLNPALYLTLLQITSNPQDKYVYKSLFNVKFPRFANIPIIHDL